MAGPFQPTAVEARCNVRSGVNTRRISGRIRGTWPNSRCPFQWQKSNASGVWTRTLDMLKCQSDRPERHKRSHGIATSQRDQKDHPRNLQTIRNTSGWPEHPNRNRYSPLHDRGPKSKKQIGSRQFRRYAHHQPCGKLLRSLSDHVQFFVTASRRVRDRNQERLPAVGLRSLYRRR